MKHHYANRTEIKPLLKTRSLPGYFWFSIHKSIEQTTWWLWHLRWCKICREKDIFILHCMFHNRKAVQITRCQSYRSLVFSCTQNANLTEPYSDFEKVPRKFSTKSQCSGYFISVHYSRTQYSSKPKTSPLYPCYGIRYK